MFLLLIIFVLQIGCDGISIEIHSTALFMTIIKEYEDLSWNSNRN